MAEWSLLGREWPPGPSPPPYDPFHYKEYDSFYQEMVPQPCPPQAQHYLSPPSPTASAPPPPQDQVSPPPLMPPPMPLPLPVPYLPSQTIRGDNPRDIRNKAEKQRRDNLNQSIGMLASIVPPVVAASRKINKTGVLRLTAHYLRAHQYVFGDSIGHGPEFSAPSTRALLGLLNGFLLTTTYKGIVVVVSQNVSEFLGYTELDLLGQNILNITHEEDRALLRDQLMPRSQVLGANGELLVPDEQAREKVSVALANEKRRFTIRLKKLGQRSEPAKYVTCHVEGSLRKSDKECHGFNKCCHNLRRPRTRADNPYSSGNDVVFIGVVRPAAETFINESAMESYRMEYRTRHSVDGEIIQVEQRIALVTGYMTHEVNGLNAMNFIHKDEVRWVIVALREMFSQKQLFGESCYRLMTKNGEFIYLRTRGHLDVDKESRAVTTFMCTNTVVDEEEGKHLIQLMKEKFNLAVNNNESEPIRNREEMSDSQSVPVEDPRQLEKVILNLVTNLPSPQSDDYLPSKPEDQLAIIPPTKERIVSAIEKIYDIFKTIPKQPSILETETLEPFEVAPFNPQHGIETNPVLSYCPEPSEKIVEINELTNLTYGPSTSADYIPSIDLTFNDDNDYDMSNDYEGQMSGQILSGSVLSGAVLSCPVLGGTSAVGVKRMMDDFEDEEAMFKKKIVDSNEQSEPMPDASPALESLFDDAMLSQEIEDAIHSLDQTIDPNFPDLLISKEVQEILGKMDEEQNIVM